MSAEPVYVKYQGAENLEGLKIKGFLPASLNEWGGRIASVVFLENCNMRCPFCHGWRFVTGSDELPDIDLSEILSHFEAKKGWVDGVVISGGEPTVSKGLFKLIDLFRDYGLEIKLHTNGLRPDVIKEILDKNMLECLSLDFKAPLESERLEIACGVKADPAKIIESFKLAAESDIEVEFHTTLCPAVINLDDLEKMAEYLSEKVPGASWYIQQYNSDDVLDIEKAGTGQIPLPEIERMVEKLSSVYSGIRLL